ncbi:MAG: hypothetical protein PVF50_11975 [Gammaproteobacteria bacterium]|jgi:hypothetical protein
MPDPGQQFVELERLLRCAGVVDANARRLVDELRDHYIDLYDEARNDGYDKVCAHTMALGAIGAPEEIAAVAAQYRSLLSVTWRYPLIADIAHGVVMVAGVPALPIRYCAQRRELIARWSASVGLAGMITAGLLLTLQTLLGTI